MASNAKDLFGCPYCGFRVNPLEDTCPRCGNKFTGDTRFECPFCGDLVAPGSKSCPTCHVDFVEFQTKREKRPSEDTIDSLLMEIIRMESEQVKSEDKKLSCPNCSWLLNGTEDRCPKCGRTFIEDVTFMCPVCGSSVSSEAEKCPECGAIFVGEEEEEDAQRVDDEHAEVTSRLSEILTAAQEHITESDESVAEEKRPSEPVPEPTPEPEPMPEPVSAPEPEPVEPASESVNEAEVPANTPAKKPTRTRKLKAKTPPKKRT